jgi:hypothetical protein
MKRQGLHKLTKSLKQTPIQMNQLQPGLTIHSEEVCLAKKKWHPKTVTAKKTKVGQERFEQLLAEVGEVLYKQLCQQVQVDQSLTEPALQELGNNQLKKAVSL